MNSLPELPTPDCARQQHRNRICGCSEKCAARAQQIRAVQRARKKKRSGRVETIVAAMHITNVLAARPGTTLTDFAVASGVSVRNIKSIRAAVPGTWVKKETAARIFGITPERVTITTDRRPMNGRKCADLVHQMRALGFTLEDVAREAGVSPSSIRNGNLDRVRLQTFRKVQQAATVLLATHLTPATAGRQVEALLVSGWLDRDLERLSGASRESIKRVLRREVVGRSVLEKVDAVFGRLQFQVGPSKDGAARARRLGFAPWAAWREGEMMRADAKPDFEFVSDLVWREALRARYEGVEGL